MFFRQTSLDSQLIQLLDQFPQTTVFDEYWCKNQLMQAGDFDSVLGFEWALMTGRLVIIGFSPTVSWQLVRCTSPLVFSVFPSIYVPATAYIELEGAFSACYPALPPEVCRYLTAV